MINKIIIILIAIFSFSFAQHKMGDDKITVVSTGVKTNGKFLLEGYTTGKNIIRRIEIKVVPGTTPGTDITITILSQFNSVSISGGSNIAKDDTVGSFSLSANGKKIEMLTAETVIEIFFVSTTVHKLNTASTTELYFADASMNANDNIEFFLRKRGALGTTDLTTILDAGDQWTLKILYLTED